jgi:uncharacterized protein (DUF3084 family)
MALQDLYPLFKNTKKQRLSKDFDLFARDHAPLYRIDALKRQCSVAEHELDKAFDKATEERVAPWDSEPMDYEIVAELEERKKMVTEGDKLRKEVLGALGKMQTHTTKIDEESTRIRKEIADYILSILPDAKDLLVKIDLHIQGEMQLLKLQNTELIGQNAELFGQNAVLKSQAEQAGSSKDAEIMAILQKVQGNLEGKTEEEKAEFKRLKEVEEEFIWGKKIWDHARQTFEANEEQFRADIEQAKEEFENCASRLNQMKRLSQEADEEIKELENEREQLGEELAKEKRNASDEKQRARELQASLGEELDEKERKDRQTRQLEEEMQQLCQSKDERIQQLETEKQELDQTKDQTIQQVAMEKQKLAQTKDQKIQQLEKEKQELAQTKNQHIQQLDKEKQELLQNAASKDRQISKLERKVEKSAADFELAKDRYREYYGISQVQEREHQGLLTSNDRFSHLLEHVTNAAHRKSNRIDRLHGGNMRLKKVVMGKNKQLLERNERISRMMAQENTLEQQKSTLLAENEELQIDRDSWKKAAEDFDTEQTVWFEENERLEKSVDSWKKYAEDLDEEKRTWQQEKITLQNDSTTWKNAADALGAEKIVRSEKRLEMESVTSTLLEALSQAHGAWDDEKDALKLQLEGSGNVALENSNNCTILVAQNDLQAAQLQGLDEELRNVIEEMDAASRDLTAMTNEKNEAHQALLTMTTQRDDAQRDLASMIEDRDTAKFDLDRRTTERDEVQRGLESVTKELDATTTKLSTTIIERDDAQRDLESVTKELDATTADLNTTTIERDEAQRGLESVTKERDSATTNLNTTIIERDNVQRNLELVMKERDAASTSLDKRTTERDDARRDLDSMMKEKDAIAIDLHTRTTERDDAHRDLDSMTKERDATAVDLHARTIERDDAHRDLDSMTKERDTTAVDLHARITERDNAQRNLESITKERDQFHEELQFAIESTQQLQETFDEQKNQLEEARKECDTSEEKSDKYREAWVSAKTVYHTLKKDFDHNLKEGQELEEEHRLCAKKIDSEVHQQLQQRFDTLSEEHSSCQGLQQRLDKLRLDHSVCPDEKYFVKLKEMEWQHTVGLWVEKSGHNSLQEQFDSMNLEHSTCPDKETFAKLMSEHDRGLWVEKAVHDSLQEQLNATKQEHSSCLDEETIAGLQKLQIEHDEGLWVGKTAHDSLQQRFDSMDSEHSTCPDKMEFSELEEMKLSHGEGLCAAQATLSTIEEEKERLRDLCNNKVDLSELGGVQKQVESWKSNHGVEKCVGKEVFNVLNGRFKTISKEHGQCPGVDELQRLRTESQHDNCVDQTTYDGLMAHHQQCLTADEVQQLRGTATQHEECPTADEIKQLREDATQHQQCLSVDEVRMLHDFHSNHSNCVDRGSYDTVFNALGGCGQQLAQVASLRQEYETFKIAHQDCEDVAAQLGQLQEEHRRCGEGWRSGTSGQGRSAQSSPVIGTMGAGGFQMPGTPRSQNRRISVPQTPAIGPASAHGSGQSSPASGIFASPTTPGSGGIAVGNGSMGLGGIRGNPPGQSPSTAGTFGPPLQQLGSRPYTFLISGELASGQCTLSVNPSVIQLMDAQITRWTSKPEYIDWSKPTSVSHKRCSDTRVYKVGVNRNPPASENPNAACKDCVRKRVLCTLIGTGGPVVVPLPISERSAGATPTSGEYYVKERKIVNAP